MRPLPACATASYGRRSDPRAVRDGDCPHGLGRRPIHAFGCVVKQIGQVAKCTSFTCAATRKALAATVKPGFKAALEGKNELSTT